MLFVAYSHAYSSASLSLCPLTLFFFTFSSIHKIYWLIVFEVRFPRIFDFSAHSLVHSFVFSPPFRWCYFWFVAVIYSQNPSTSDLFHDISANVQVGPVYFLRFLFIFFVSIFLRLIPNTYFPYVYFPLSLIIFLSLLSRILIYPVYPSVSLSHHFLVNSLTLLPPWSYYLKLITLRAYFISLTIFPSVYSVFFVSFSLGLLFPNSLAFTKSVYMCWICYFPN